MGTNENKIQKMDMVELDRTEVLRYFKEILSDEEIWNGNSEQINAAAVMLHGALVFAKAFDLVTDAENSKLMFDITELRINKLIIYGGNENETN